MTFKEVLEEDTAIFLNLEEFGEKHFIDGEEMTVLIDDNENLERQQKYRNLSGIEEDTYTEQILFYVSQKDFGELPCTGRNLSFDNESYRIAKAINESGIYSITLEAITNH